MDPVVWRTAFAITGLASGTGLWLYGGAWLLMRSSEGGPAMAEQLLDRRFAPESVLTLLGLALASATALSLIGGISGGTLMLATPLILGGLTAHSRGIDLKQALRDLPAQLKAKEPPPVPPKPEPAPTYYNPAQPWAAAPSGPVDLSVIAHQSAQDTAEDSGEENEEEEEDQDGEHTATERARISAQRAREQARETTERQRERKKARRRERGILLFTPVFWVIVVAGIIFGVSGEHPLSALLGPVFLGSVVTVIGAALLAGTWFGDRRGLVSLGALVTLLAIATTSTDLTSLRLGSEHWRPAAPAEVREYQLDGGQAELDLTAMELEPGERVDVSADVRFGEVKVVVPETARVDVHATAAFGSVLIGDERWSGGNLDVRRAMEPGSTGGAPEDAEREQPDEGGAEPAELNVRLMSHSADMEVRRVAR
ncbi:hypothetical protein F4561_004831 [Lipingzhangella halophila]|uniref:Cell wall-active antibiotics response LiaF-like C-terminal domain-containing protein n=1 Tax=Lipingzhangella halophila TaxID=1783352 RepID=A0A7W7RL94_9ACTN|nr:hypothetical protein [Lipingzhangella halophila]